MTGDKMTLQGQTSSQCWLRVQAGGPVHHQGEGAVADAQFSQRIDDEAPVAGHIIGSRVQQRFSHRGLEQNFWRAGLESAIADDDGELHNAIAAHGKKSFAVVPPDRKSTRLNSSHPSISYAVFCL